MSWTKYFNSKTNTNTKINDVQISNNKYSTVLPEVYAGQPGRMSRYDQYDEMDYDSQVCSALDIIAEFSTQTEENYPTPFKIKYNNSELSGYETKVINETLKHWVELNNLKGSRMFTIFRNYIKYGDVFFLRDPETFQLYLINHKNVDSVKCDDSMGKIPVIYNIRGIELNLPAKVASTMTTVANTQTVNVSSPDRKIINYTANNKSNPVMRYTNISNDASLISSQVDACHVVQCSLTQGLDTNWPFGNSILESVFKVFKQKSLLEDAIIIYRIQRAPERRVFYIDVGEMHPHKAKAHVEALKNEIRQRRIPNRNGGGTSVVDASYNPLSMLDDFFLPVTSTQRGSKIETLPGGEGLGQIDDLVYFDNKLRDGLRIPKSYMPTPDSDGAVFSDGKVGTAYMQEYRFAKYCQRLQSIVNEVFDKEFKMFLKFKGYDVDTSTFSIELHPPQNFSKYRELELNSAYITQITSLDQLPYISKRLLLMKYLGWSMQEVLDNEKFHSEENKKSKIKDDVGISDLPDDDTEESLSDLEQTDDTLDSGNEENLETPEETSNTSSDNELDSSSAESKI